LVLLYYFTYIDDARSNANEVNKVLVHMNTNYFET